MVGNGALNILLHKKWNVSNFNNRKKVTKDKGRSIEEHMIEKDETEKEPGYKEKYSSQQQKIKFQKLKGKKK